MGKMNKGIKQSHLSGFDTISLDHPDIGWIRVVLNINFPSLDAELLGTWITGSGVTVTHREATDIDNLAINGKETTKFIESLVSKVNRRVVVDNPPYATFTPAGGVGPPAAPRIVGICTSSEDETYVATDRCVYAICTSSIQKIFDIGDLAEGKG